MPGDARQCWGLSGASRDQDLPATPVWASALVPAGKPKRCHFEPQGEICWEKSVGVRENAQSRFLASLEMTARFVSPARLARLVLLAPLGIPNSAAALSSAALSRGWLLSPVHGREDGREGTPGTIQHATTPQTNPSACRPSAPPSPS